MFRSQANADRLREKTIELGKRTDDLSASANESRAALDDFFASALGDETGGFQLSNLFRNDLATKMTKHYGHLLDRHANDHDLHIEICGRVSSLVENLLNLQHFYAAYDLAAWNWNRILPIVNDELATAEDLTLASKINYQLLDNASGWKSSQTQLFPPNAGQGTRDPEQLVRQLLKLSKRAVDSGGGPEARLYWIMARVQSIAKQELAPDVAKHQLQGLCIELDELSEANPDSTALLYFRSQYPKRTRKVLGAAEIGKTPRRIDPNHEATG